MMNKEAKTSQGTAKGVLAECSEFVHGGRSFEVKGRVHSPTAACTSPSCRLPSLVTTPHIARGSSESWRLLAQRRYAWEDSFMRIIRQLRQLEVTSISRINMLRAFNAVRPNPSPACCSPP